VDIISPIDLDRQIHGIPPEDAQVLLLFQILLRLDVLINSMPTEPVEVIERTNHF